MARQSTWKVFLAGGILLAATGTSIAGNKNSAPAPAASKAQAPHAAPGAGGAPGGHPISGGGAPGGHPISGGAAAGKAGGAHSLSSIAPPPGAGGGAHSLSAKAPPAPISGAHPAGSTNAPAAAHADRPSAANERPAERRPEPALQHQPDRVTHEGTPGRPSFTAPAKVVGTAADNARATHALTEHRTNFARNFGPGHDVVRDREFVHLHEHDFHDRDFHHFNDFERARWRAGLWHEDWHYGRWGWWYSVDDVWYPYAEPIYPHPLTVSEIVVPETTLVEVPVGAVAFREGQPTVAAPVSIAITVPAGPEVIVRPLPPAPIVGYQCTPLAGSYPAVRLCPATWIIVPE